MKKVVFPTERGDIVTDGYMLVFTFRGSHVVLHSVIGGGTEVFLDRHINNDFVAVKNSHAIESLAARLLKIIDAKRLFLMRCYNGEYDVLFSLVRKDTFGGDCVTYYYKGIKMVGSMCNSKPRILSHLTFNVNSDVMAFLPSADNLKELRRILSCGSEAIEENIKILSDMRWIIKRCIEDRGILS